MSRTFTPEEFPSNSVGITHVLDGKAEFEYFKGNGIAPYGLFNHAPSSMVGLSDEQREKLRIWPKDGQLINEKLVVGLVLIVESDNMFDTLGVDYAQIDNPYASPDKWKVNYIQSLRSSSVFPATALTEHGEYLYSLTTIIKYLENNQQRQTMALLRYSSENFDVSKSVPEYYSVDAKWKTLSIDSGTLRITDEDTIIDDIKIISEHGNTEATLHLDDESGQRGHRCPINNSRRHQPEKRRQLGDFRLEAVDRRSNGGLERLGLGLLLAGRFGCGRCR